jgi:hypothetical protein
MDATVQGAAVFVSNPMHRTYTMDMQINAMWQTSSA